MTIRQLSASDYDRVLDLWQRAGLDTIRPKGRDAPDVFAREVKSKRAAVLGVVTADDALVGVVVATHDGRKGWINRLAVEPARRREGIGRRLVEAAERTLKAAGIHVIAALIEGDNQSSLDFFRSAGYRSAPDVRYLSKRSAPEA